LKKKTIAKSDLDFAIALSKKAGELLLRKSKKIGSLKIKVKEACGLASNADTESEALIISEIKKKYPTHYILAEENAYLEYKSELSKFMFLKDHDWVWIIDPLDGTNNFLSGLDYYAVCISLVHKGNPVLGVVYRPGNGDLFYALKGKGSFYRNIQSNSKNRSLKFKSNKKLKEALLVTGFTTEKGEVFDQEFDLFKMMMGKSRGIRRMGSAALDLCYLSSGIFDCFWERGLAPWDVAAAGLIAMEAGVEVSDYKGRAFHPFQETILAARPLLHKEVLKIFCKGL
jgi:myo-inositol-1(or 4)-monophosphatase